MNTYRRWQNIALWLVLTVLLVGGMAVNVGAEGPLGLEESIYETLATTPYPQNETYIWDILEQDQKGIWNISLVVLLDPEINGRFLSDFLYILSKQDANGNWVSISHFDDEIWDDWINQIDSELVPDSLKEVLLEDKPDNDGRPPSQIASVNYYLPAMCGDRIRVTQSNHGGKAIDFQIDSPSLSVASVADGTVVYAQWNSNTTCEYKGGSWYYPGTNTKCPWTKGNYVALKHSDNTYTFYLHLAYNSVPSNIRNYPVTIKNGVKLGQRGNTGWSFGAHLHYARGASIGSARYNTIFKNGSQSINSDTMYPGQSWTSQNCNIDSIRPTISNLTPTCQAANNVWQNTCYDPHFSWNANDNVGVTGIDISWEDADAPSNWQSRSGSTREYDPPAITTADGVAEYRFDVRAKDQAGNTSSRESFLLYYDGSAPTLDNFTVAGGSSIAYGSNVGLALSANDTGSGVAEMRFATNGQWSDWQAYQSTANWSIPPLNGQTFTIQAQVRDKAGNESGITSQNITLDLYPVAPHSANFRLCNRVINSGGSLEAGNINYQLLSSMGEAISGDSYSGFIPTLGACAPITKTTSTVGYQLVQSVFGNGGSIRGNPNYRLGDTLGETVTSGATPLSSTVHLVSSGFWANVTGTIPNTTPVTATPTPLPTATPGTTPPTPTPTSVASGFGLSINQGELYTNNPQVSVGVSAPNVESMRFSNDGGFINSGWMPYQITRTWTISTYGNTILPRYVYVWFRDDANRIYGPYFDDIIYDPTAPEGELVIGPTVQNRATGVNSTTLYIYAWDDNSGVSDMRLSTDSAFGNADWQAIQGTVAWTGTTSTLYAQFRDAAGNVSEVVTGTQVVNQPPTAILTLRTTREVSDTILYPDDMLNSGEMFITDADASFDIYDDVLTYTFHFDDQATVGPQTVPTATHSFNSAGIYTITVDVSDGEYTDTATQSVRIVSNQEQIYLPLVLK